MCVIWRKFIVLMFICQYSRILIESLSINPTLPQLYRINYMVEGEELRLDCRYESSTPQFNSAGIVFSLLQRNFSFAGEFYIKSSVLAEDSGWYRCSRFHNPIYISVGSNSGYFVVDKVSSMLGISKNYRWDIDIYGPKPYIYCKPINSSYDVQVYKDDKPWKPVFDMYDPKIDYIPVEEPGLYKCELTTDNQVIAMKEYNLTEFDASELLISGDQCFHFNNETELRVNCSIADILSMPREHDPRRREKSPPEWSLKNAETIDYEFNKYADIEHPIYDNYMILTQELVIRTIFDGIMRELECSASYGDVIRNKKIYLVINRPDFRGINLFTTFFESSKIIETVGNSVRFTVEIEAYPDQPDIIWRDPRGREVLASREKFEIENSCERTTLIINDLSMEDRGPYRVEAKTSDPGSSKTLTFDLDVWGKGFIKTLDNVAEYYLQNQTAKIECIVDESRKLSITWNFQERLNPLSNLSKSTLDGIIIESNKTTLVWKVKSSGYITCTACDISDNVPSKCENITRPIFMTDVSGGFGIISPNREIITNETVELICAASIHHFTEKIEWLDNFGTPLVATDRLNLHFIRTVLSYQAILTFNSVSAVDNGTYICSSTSHQTRINRANYTLRVYDPVKPYFIKTNMNGSIEKNFNTTTSSEHIILECYPGGRPQPVVSWWKDAARMNTTNQTDAQVCRHNFRNKYQQLYIDNLDEDCTALYQCQATNNMGVIEAHQSIIIKRVESPEAKGSKSSASQETSSPNKMIIILFVTFFVVIICLGSTISLWRERRLAEVKLNEMGQEDFQEGRMDFLKSGLTYAERTQFQPYEEQWELPRENLSFQGILGTGSFGVVQIARAKDLVGEGTDWLVAVKKPRNGGNQYVFVKTLARELKIMMHLGKHLNVVNLLGACTTEMEKFGLLVIMEYCHFGNLCNYLRDNDSEFISQINAVTGEIDLSIDRDESDEKRSSESSPPDAGENEMSSEADMEKTEAEYDHDESIESQSSESSPPVTVVGRGELFTDAIMNKEMDDGDREVNTEDTLSSNKGPSDRRIFEDPEFLPLKTKTLLSWAFQVSNGMEYLRQKKVLHGDLAARNILLAKRNVVKISDFGLSKELHENYDYRKTSDRPLPFKWMAIESLKDGIFSTQSDVWSFGIVLWEFFELGNQPYEDIPKSELLGKLENGYRMEKPKHANQRLYDLMMQCWDMKPDSRPSFNDLIAWFGCLMDQDEKVFLEKLNIPYHAENKK